MLNDMLIYQRQEIMNNDQTKLILSEMSIWPEL